MLARAIKTAVCVAFMTIGAAATDKTTEWQQDIDFFVRGISAQGTAVDLTRGISTRGQKDFEKLYPKDSFDTAIASLKESLPTLTDAEIVLRLMRIVAGANVAHNSVQVPKSIGFEQRIPLNFVWYSDGLAVTAATQAYAQAIGLRVLKLGSMEPEKLLEAIAPFVSYESDAWLRRYSQGFMTLRPFLDHLHLIGPDGMVSVTLERPGREPLVLRVPVTESQETRIGFWEALGISKPLYLTQPRKRYWNQYLEDSQTAYIQYNVCANDPQLAFADFTHAVMVDIDARLVKRVVIDLRLNSGGNSTVMHPLTKALASRSRLAGHIFVLIGPTTFSSALLNAMELKRDLHATLIGEPTGGSPNGYGEVKLLTLPNSKLVVQYTSKYFGSHNSDNSSLKPDVAAPLTLSDALSGRDPALNAAISAKE